MKLKEIIAVVAVFQLAAGEALAAVGYSTVTVNLEQVQDGSRWMYASTKAAAAGGPLVQAMVDAKRALLAKDRERCLTSLKKVSGLGKSLGPWIALNQLQCSVLKDKSGKLNATQLQEATRRLDAEPRWVLTGPASTLLRTAYVQNLVALADIQSRTDRRAVWATLDKLNQVRSWLGAEDRAMVFRTAGEMAFVDQNLMAAQDFLLRSLNEKDSSELRARVQSIRLALLKKKEAVPGSEVQKPPANEELGISESEREIYSRMLRAFDTQDYLSVIEDGIQLLTKFPGSKRAQEAADKILDVYLTVAAKSDDKFRHVKESAVKEMAKADGMRVSRWASSAYNKANYVDAFVLAQVAVQKLAGQPESTRMLLLSGKSALASGQLDEAKVHFDKLLQQHAGTPESIDATFRLGIIEFRAKKFGPAASYFERLLALPKNDDFEYRALYWQWRSQQRLDATKANVYAEPLIAKYPLTYYGLRARAEIANNILSLPSKSIPVRADIPMLESERLTWERVTLLLKAGWLKEAEKEIDSLPLPQSNEEKLVYAKLWGQVLRYDEAIGLANKVFEDSADYLQTPLLKLTFPKEYASFVSREAKASSVSENWIWSLIRQESSFRPEIRSPANALGVMQLLTPTAQEIAREYKVKDFSGDSLLIPEVNIKLGTVYLARLIRSFNGNMPLALAAYNAGPTRLRRWLNARKDLSPLEGTASSSPDVEVWIDELPWEETSQYVKGILRNWLIYRSLDSATIALSEPIWVDEKTSSR